MNSTVGIIDYGMGNLASVGNALDFMGVENAIVSDPDKLCFFDKLILPGVGAFGQAMERLTDTGLAAAIRQYVLTESRPLLGICLGMQLLLSKSCEHGEFAGLDIVEGEVKELERGVERLPVPNIGWSPIRKISEATLLGGIEDEDLCFYFVHSYYCNVADRSRVIGVLGYGITIDVVLDAGNVFGCQFHPEKSQRSGLKVLTNFVEM